jgi:hypothetical protein
MEEIEKKLKGEDSDEPITIDTGSFFHYFEEKDDEFDVSLITVFSVTNQCFV